MGGGIINLTPVDTCAGSGGEENIIDFAHDDKIDLLVISTHGSGGLSRWNISSVLEKVINLVYLPVLIVRAYSQRGGGRWQDPLSPHSPPDRQLAPCRVLPVCRDCQGTGRNVNGLCV